MADAGVWQPARGILREAAPRHSALLAAAPEHPSPGESDCVSEGAERGTVHGTP